MNKDAILASIIGFGIGLLITGGVIVGPRLLSKLKQSNSGDVASATTDKKNETTPTVQPEQSLQALTIDSPAKDAIVTDASLNVSGKAPKHSTIIIGSSEDETIVDTQDSSSYQGKVSLKEGKNDISVVSVTDSKSSLERVTVYYQASK